MEAEHQTRAGGSSAAKLRRSLYAVLLVAVGFYALLVLLWPAPAAFCVADCVVVLRAATPDARLPSLGPGELMLICGTGWSDGPRLEVADTADGMRIRIECSSTSPRQAVREVERSALHFVQRAPAYVAARTSAHRDRNTQQHEQQCWLALQDRLQKLLECASSLTSVDDLASENSEPTDTVPVSTGADQATSPLNPMWVEVSDKLESQRQRLEDLLRTRTSEHPEVQALRANIDQLVRSVDQIPMLAPPAPAPTSDTASAVQADHEVKTRVEDVLTAIHKNIGELESAKQQLQSALSAYATARSVAHSANLDEPLSLWFAEVSRPGHLISREYGRGPARHPELLLLALSGALTLVWCIRPRRPIVLESVSQLRQSWGANVVAVIGEVRTAPAITTIDWTPQLTQIAQWWVLLLLTIVLVLAVGDPNLIGNLWHDPAMAIREAWSNWMVR